MMYVLAKWVVVAVAVGLAIAALLRVLAVVLEPMRGALST